MKRDDIQKLLGGYATGTLTPEEQQALFEAALDDQELFDALAREQALRDLLRDPAAKAHLLAALDRRPPRWYERLGWSWRPVAAAVAMAGVGTIAVVMVRQSVRAPQPVLVAQVSPSPAASDMAATRPESANQAVPPLAAANPAPPQPAMGDVNARARRDTDALARRLAKESPAKPVAALEGVGEEDRRAKVRLEAQAAKRKDVAVSLAETPSLAKGEAPSLPAAPPMPPRTYASGFREGAPPAGVARSLGGMLPAAPPPPAEKKAEALFRSELGRASGGAVGGAVGGVVGGVSRAAPPAPATPAPPKADAQASQSAQLQGATSLSGPSQLKQSQAAPSQSGPSQSAPSQSALSQSAQGLQRAPAQLEQFRLAKSPGGIAQETAQVQAAASSVDALSVQDARSLFYGNFGAAQAFNGPGARNGAAGAGGDSPMSVAAPKKAAESPEKARDQRQSGESNSLAVTTRSVQALLAPNPGVRYSLLRKTATGGFEAVDPDSVKTGDTLELQFMPNYGGTLSVRGRSGNGPWRDVMASPVDARKTYTTPPLRSGEKELQVLFTRLPAGLTGVALRDDQPGAGVSRQSTAEPATYVVGGPASRQLQFTITLNYQ
jgi:hypothetical protein